MNRTRRRRTSHYMSRAMTPRQHEMSQLNGSATAIIDRITLEDRERFNDRQRRFDLEMFDLESKFDVSAPWPEDTIAEHLSNWRLDLSWEAMELGVTRAMRDFAVFADAAGIAVEAVAEFGELVRSGLREWAAEEWWVAR